MRSPQRVGRGRKPAYRAALIFLLVGLVLGLLAPRIFAADPNSHSGQQRVHVVSNGQTLWSLAGKFAGDDDPRKFVHEVKLLNGLEGGAIFPGQRLILPPS